MKRSIGFSFLVLFTAMYFLLPEIGYLRPYTWNIWQRYGIILCTFAGALLINMVAGLYLLQRKFLMRETGRKLQHVLRQTGRVQSNGTRT
jgi:hypothetical protein